MLTIKNDMEDNRYNLNKYFQSFKTKKVLVIGDIMLDEYCYGKVERISPEAPIPVVKVESKEYRPGGAGNVIVNLKSLGATPLICSVIGNDLHADTLRQLLLKLKINSKGLIVDKKRPTSCKTRIIAGKQQMVRVDEESDELISKEISEKLYQAIKQWIDLADAVIIQDYDKGVLGTENIFEIIKLCRRKGKFIAVDPKKRNFLKYKNVNLLKPNLKELNDGLNKTIDAFNISEVREKVKKFKKMMNVERILLTLSENGVYYDGLKVKTHIPAHKIFLSDVSGAGDTVISTVALCFAAGMDEDSAVTIGNLSGGLVCQKPGVVPVDREELLAETRKFFKNQYDKE